MFVLKTNFSRLTFQKQSVSVLAKKCIMAHSNKRPKIYCKINDVGLEKVFLPDTGKARGFYINNLVTNQFIKSLSS